MAAASVVEIVTSLIRDNWAHTPVRAYDTDIESHVPSDMSAYAELTFPHSREEQSSIGTDGNRLYREEGGFAFCLYAPLNESVQTWLTRIDELRDEVRGFRASSSSFRVYEAPSPVINDRSDVKGYREISIAVLYEYDIFR